MSFYEKKLNSDGIQMHIEQYLELSPKQQSMVFSRLMHVLPLGFPSDQLDRVLRNVNPFCDIEAYDHRNTGEYKAHISQLSELQTIIKKLK